MGNRHDELGLDLLRLGDLLAHLVDGLHHLAHLILVFLVDLYAVAALRNALRRFGDLTHRFDERPDEKQIDDNDDQHHHGCDGAGQQEPEKDLSVRQLHAGDIPHDADDLTVCIDHRRRYAHNPLPGTGAAAGPVGDRPGLQHVGHILGIRNRARGNAGGRDDDTFIGADELELQPVVLIKCLGILVGGIVVFRVAFHDVVREKVRSGFGLHLKAGAHGGIQGAGGDSGKRRDSHHQHDRHSQHGAAHPALLDPVDDGADAFSEGSDIQCQAAALAAAPEAHSPHL